MHKIRVVAVGKIKDNSIKALIEEYKKRLTPFCKIEEVIVKDNARNVEERVSSLIVGKVFVLDSCGIEYDSVEFSDLITKEESITFVVGGPEGFSSEFKSNYLLLSLSKMTFPHEIARLILYEQIYRAFMIANNRNYHK